MKQSSTSGWTIDRQDIDPVQDAVDIDGSFAVATQMQFFRPNSYDIPHDFDLTRNYRDKIYFLYGSFGDQ